MAFSEIFIDAILFGYPLKFFPEFTEIVVLASSEIRHHYSSFGIFLNNSFCIPFKPPSENF